jgi:hypothetical protein
MNSTVKSNVRVLAFKDNYPMRNLSFSGLNCLSRRSFGEGGSSWGRESSFSAMSLHHTKSRQCIAIIQKKKSRTDNNLSGFFLSKLDYSTFPVTQ